MKKLTIILFLITFFKPSFSQTYFNYPIIDEKVIFERIFEFDSIKKEKIHQYAVEYFSLMASNANYTIKLNDKETGVIIAKGIFSNLGKMVNGYAIAGNWNCSIRMDSKDGKIRGRIFDLYKTTSSTSSGLSIEEINQSYTQEKENKTKRAGALSEEAAHVSNFCERYLSGLKEYIVKRSNDDF